MPEEPLKLEESSFSSHSFSTEIFETKFNFRILKMVDSVFIYIGEATKEVLDDVAVAMPGRNNEVVGTTALGVGSDCESEELALKLAKKLRKQVYISRNIVADRSMKPLLEKRLGEEINEHPEYFT